MKLAAVFFLALFAPCVYSQGWVVHKVADVVDAETVILESERGNKTTVRIAGIDAPEIDQPFGKESADKLTALLKGQTVTAQLIKIDGNKRMVSRLRLNDVDVGESLIKTGFAWHRNDRGELPDEEAARYALAQAEARSSKVGLWADNPIEPKQWRKGKAVNPTFSGNVGDIFIGLVSTNYYYPFNCDEARFDPDEVQRTFYSEVEAQKAGFKKGTICSKPKPLVSQTFTIEMQPLRTARAIKIIQMTTDYSSFRDKLVTLEGEVSMSKIYVGAFYGEDDLFFSFKIDDGTDAILAFTAKNSGAAQLRQRLLRSADATVWAKVRVRILGRTEGDIVFGSMIDFESR